MTTRPLFSFHEGSAYIACEERDAHSDVLWCFFYICNKIFSVLHTWLSYGDSFSHPFLLHYYGTGSSFQFQYLHLFWSFLGDLASVPRLRPEQVFKKPEPEPEFQQCNSGSYNRNFNMRFRFRLNRNRNSSFKFRFRWPGIFIGNRNSGRKFDKNMTGWFKWTHISSIFIKQV